MITFKYGEALVWAVRDPERSRIIRLLAERRAHVSDIEQELGIPAHRVVSHLELLASVNLVEHMVTADTYPEYTVSRSMRPLIDNYLAIGAQQTGQNYPRARS